MHNKHWFFTSIVLLVLVIQLVGCDLLAEDRTTPPVLDPTLLLQTSQSEATQAAGLTQTASLIQQTNQSLTQTAAVTLSPIPTLDRTRPVISTPTKDADCNAASPGIPLDVTIRDDTQMSPGQAFIKTWRLMNSGSCKWTRLYKLVFFSGNPMGAAQEIYLAGEVEPNEMIDLSVDMIAPNDSGFFQSNWMLADPQGNLFGIGPNGDAPFWVRIEVIQQITTTPVPTITLTPTPIVYYQGFVSLSHTNFLDLDTGTVNPVEDLADLQYLLEAPNHTFVSDNNAGMMLFGNDEPEYLDCRYATLEYTPLIFESVEPDTYVCYQTDQGLPGWFHLLSFDELTGIVIVEFLTWSLSD